MKIVNVIWTLFCAMSVSGHKIPPEYEDDDDEPPPQPEDIPDKYYDSLMAEIPELRQVMAEFTARRNSDAYRDSLRYRSPSDTNSSNAVHQSGRRIYQDNPDDFRLSHDTHFEANNYISKKTMYRRKKTFPKVCCFWCGMNVTYFVPTTSLCHDAFESSDYRLRALQRFFRGKCYYTNPIYVNYGSRTYGDLKYFGTFQGWSNMIYGSYYSRYTNATDKYRKGKWGIGFFYDYGLKRNFFGQYLGGCFKRYLDVGNVYTQRGCKHFWPIKTYGATSTLHRFRKLEYVLRWQKDACISSTHASLTPFNRAISLYARYHVCVCDSRYCNGAGSARLSTVVSSAAVLFLRGFNIIWIN